MHFIEPDESVLDIIENDLTNYERKDDLNYGKTFFLNKSLSDFVIGFENYSQLKINNIWTLSKLSKYFTGNHYSIPDKYRDTVLSVNYKMNLIEGYLMFANSYINNKNRDSNYRDELFFYRSNNFDALVSEIFKEGKKIAQLDTQNYKSLLKAFIGKHLYDEIANESKSMGLCTQLFNLID